MFHRAFRGVHSTLDNYEGTCSSGRKKVIVARLPAVVGVLVFLAGIVGAVATTGLTLGFVDGLLLSVP